MSNNELVIKFFPNYSHQDINHCLKYLRARKDLTDELICYYSSNNLKLEFIFNHFQEILTLFPYLRSADYLNDAKDFNFIHTEKQLHSSLIYHEVLCDLHLRLNNYHVFLRTNKCIVDHLIHLINQNEPELERCYKCMLDEKEFITKEGCDKTLVILLANMNIYSIHLSIPVLVKKLVFIHCKLRNLIKMMQYDTDNCESLPEDDVSELENNELTDSFMKSLFDCVTAYKLEL